MLRLRTEVAIDAGKIQQFYHHEKNLNSPDVRARRTYRQCWSAIHDILHASRQAPVHLSWPRTSSGSRQASIGRSGLCVRKRREYSLWLNGAPPGSKMRQAITLRYRKCRRRTSHPPILRTTDCMAEFVIDPGNDGRIKIILRPE